jgi:putative endonuclease
MRSFISAYGWIKRRLGLTRAGNRADDGAGMPGEKSVAHSHADSTGGRGEQEAARYLGVLGYKTLAANFRCQIGEIDLIMQTPDAKTVVVVEVKTRDVDPARPGTMSRETKPEIRVGHHKQKKLVLLAQWAVKKLKLKDKRVRFDVVGVDLYPDGRVEIRHHPAAFESHV